MYRTRSYHRFKSVKKAIRKRNLASAIGHDETPLYDNLHQYSKNKIHFSYPVLNQKTKNKGHRRMRNKNYNRSVNYSAADRRKINHLYYDD